LWEVKTVLPRSEQDDSRPILLRQSSEFPACLTVLGAKIDSVYDVEEALQSMLGRHPEGAAAIASHPEGAAATEGSLSPRGSSPPL
jgi:hypothetical protein